MPTVGQWGQLMFEGGLLQKYYNMKWVKLPQTKDYKYLQKNYNYYNVYKIHK